MSTPIPQQPLHPSILDRLDPEYAAFHNAYVQYTTPPDRLPWTPDFRTREIPGASTPLPVGKIQDYDLTHVKIRVVTPEGEGPSSGWPVLIYFHGGGWSLGHIASEMSFVTNMCVHAHCVVVSVDYRLAPDYPYPAAVEDAIDALKWVVQHGVAKLNADIKKIAVGGSSSGGNIATILALKAASSTFTPPLPHPLIFQLLIVPVTDNTATAATSWAPNIRSPWLTPDRMNWFKSMYLPNEADWTNWDASPIFAPGDLLAKTPKAWVALAELDILREEGRAYAEKLRMAGVQVEMVVYEREPHPFMALDVPSSPAEKFYKTPLES